MAASSSKPTPTSITHDRQKRMLVITWKDGHESLYPLDLLREICPCVVCRGGHEFMGSEHDPDVLSLTPARSYTLTDIQIAGNYALTTEWHDGHNSGIYTFVYLRRNCMCDVCLAERQAASSTD